MTTTCHNITTAVPTQLEDVLALLAQVELPTEGVREFFADFLVATDEAGTLVGCIGLERYAKIGLLRSLAVAPEQQGQGLGTRLTSTLLALAAQRGVEEMVLLTTTARDFFAQQFGFQPAVRAEYDASLSASPEWRLPRCSSAAFMCLTLAPSSDPSRK